MPILSLLLAALCGTVEGSAPPTHVEEAELLRVRQGLVALVGFAAASSAASTAAPSEGADQAADPAGAPAVRPTDPERATETLVIARAVLAVSSQLDTVRVQERGEWLAALSLARNLRHLGFARRALDRYRLALEADPHAAFTHDAVLELADAAIAVGDSALLATQAQSIAERPDAASHVEAVARLLTARLAWAPGTDTAALSEQLESLAKNASPTATVAIARTRQASGEVAAALEGYRLALTCPSLPPNDFAAAARGMADCFTALGMRQDARAVYAELTRLDVGDLSAWATYQTGTLASLDGDQVAAAGAFRSLCEQKRASRWQQDACWQQRIAEQLLEIQAPDAPAAARPADATAMGGGS